MVGAIFLVILVKGVESVTVQAVRADPALWPLSYLPALAGAALGVVLLAMAGRSRCVPREGAA